MSYRWDEPHYVYRYLDVEGTILYIGCTYDLQQRHKAHSKQAEWFPQANQRTHKTYPDRWHGLVGERAAIMVNRPVYNKTYNYWQPEDERLTRQLHEASKDRKANADLIADIEERVYLLEVERQLAREEALREMWDGVDDAVFDRLRGIGATHEGARLWAKRFTAQQQGAAS